VVPARFYFVDDPSRAGGITAYSSVLGWRTILLGYQVTHLHVAGVASESIFLAAQFDKMARWIAGYIDNALGAVEKPVARLQALSTACWYLQNIIDEEILRVPAQRIRLLTASGKGSSDGCVRDPEAASGRS